MNQNGNLHSRLTTNHRRSLVCLLLVLITLLTYWQIGNCGFVNLDDGDYVFENPHVLSGLTMENVIWAFTRSHSANWHPLTWLSHMLDIEWYGLVPGGHHWTNLELHLANGLLLFLVLHLMTGALGRSGFVAALFLLHPLHVESVAWIAERKDVLSTFFWFLGMWAYIRYVQTALKRYYLLLLLFFISGLMAKPMVVTLPFVLLLMDFWPLNRFQDASPDPHPARFRREWGRCVLEKMPLFILTGISSFITYSVQRTAGAVLSHEVIPFTSRLANALVAYLDYLIKTIWPRDLAVFYPHPETASFWPVFLSCMALSGLSVLFFSQWRRFPFLIVGWLWFLGTLVPVIGLVQVGLQKMADRYTYIPIIGLFLMTAWGVSAVVTTRDYRKTLLTSISVAALLPLVILTWLQVGVWKDSISLFSHALTCTEDNFMAHYALGRPLIRQGKVDEAIDHYVRSLRIRPTFKEAHSGLGIALTRKGDLNGAIRHHMAALRINPYFGKSHYNLAKIYNRQGRADKAVFHYGKALQIDPEMKIALYNLSWLLATHADDTHRDGRRAMQLAEKLCSMTRFKEALAFDALAAAYAETGQFDKAIASAERGIGLASRSGPPELLDGLRQRLKRYRLGQAYRQRSDDKKEPLDRNQKASISKK